MYESASINLRYHRKKDKYQRSIGVMSKFFSSALRLSYVALRETLMASRNGAEDKNTQRPQSKKQLIPMK
jgi:hypothetical protein